MQVRFKYLMMAATVLLFASCKKTNEQGKLIPSNAGIVLQIDPRSLSSKLSWEEVKNNPLFKAAYNDSTLPAAVKKILDNPSSAGIDLTKDLLFFAQKDSSGGYVAFEGSIKDEAIFKTFNTEITDNGSASEKDGVNFISKFPVSVGWNKEKFVYVFDAPQMSQMDELSKRMMNDSIDISSHSARDIGATCKSIFALKESNSLGSEEKFTKLLKEPGDIHCWVNSEALNPNPSLPGPMSAIDIKRFYKGSVTAAAVNFDNGKINIQTFSYAGEELTKLYKKYSGGKINEDMLKRMPGKDIMAIMALNFKPEAIRAFLQLLGLDGFANLAQKSLGFNLDDVVKATKGDFMIGLSDLRMESDTSTSLSKEEEEFKPSRHKPDMNVIFSTSIDDKDAFNKLLTAAKKASGLNEDKSPISFNSNGTYFAIGNSKENVEKYLAGNNNNADFISKISGQPFGAFVNIQSFMKAFENQLSKDSAAKALFDVSMKTWENIVWKGGEFNNEAITSSLELNLVDKTTNSLKQLNQYSGKAGEIQLEKRRKQKEDMMAFEDAVSPSSLKDSLTASPAAKSKTQ